MDAALAATLAGLIADNLERRYPYKPGWVLEGDDDRRRPALFDGCFDWHSSVHMHYALARLVRAFPEATWSQAALAQLDRRFARATIARELEFLRGQPSFELPYGIAWLLVLCRELDRHPRLAGRLGELAALAEERFSAWLHALPGPVRGGEHGQSAFAMGLVHDSAASLRELVAERARAFYSHDREAPLWAEPSAHDFLSPSLAEAELMSRVLPSAELANWLADTLPHFRWQPVPVANSDDGKLAHAAGLNYSRAWMLRRLARRLPPGERRQWLERAAAHHRAAGWEPTAAGSYAVTHWVPTFIVHCDLGGA